MPAPSIRPGHKYLRREGTSGHYRYFYYEPTGHREATGEEHQVAVVDHVRRLLAGALHRQEPVDATLMRRIATEVGVTPTAVQWELSNMRARGRRALARQGGGTTSQRTVDAGVFGHGYATRHLTEPVFSVGTPQYAHETREKEAFARREALEREVVPARRARRSPETTRDLVARTRANEAAQQREQVAQAERAARGEMDTAFDAGPVAPGAPAVRTELPSLSRNRNVQVGTRLVFVNNLGQSLWRVESMAVVGGTVEAGPSQDEFRLVRIAGAKSRTLAMRVTRTALDRALARGDDEEGRMRVAYQEAGRASAELDEEQRQRYAADATASAARGPDIRLGTRIIRRDARGVSLWRVAGHPMASGELRNDISLVPVGSGGQYAEPIRMTVGILQGYLEQPKNARGPTSMFIAYQQGSVAHGALLEDEEARRVGVTPRDSTARREGRSPSSSALKPPEAPSTQQTAEMRSRVAAAQQAKQPGVRSAELQQRLAARGFNLEALNLPEAQIRAQLGPESAQEREYRLTTTLARHGFHLEALHLPEEVEKAVRGAVVPGHKYLRREGASGDYHYIYQESGVKNLVDKMAESGKMEVAGKEQSTSLMGGRMNRIPARVPHPPEAIIYTFRVDHPVAELQGKTVTGGVPGWGNSDVVMFKEKVGTKQIGAKMSTNPGLAEKVAAYRVAEKAEVEAKIVDLEARAPGLAQWEEASNAVIGANARYDRASEHGYPVKEARAQREAYERLEALSAKFPEARAWGHLEGMSQSANHHHGMIGNQGKEKVLAGEMTPTEAVTWAEAAWSKEAARLVANS